MNDKLALAQPMIQRCSSRPVCFEGWDYSKLAGKAFLRRLTASCTPCYNVEYTQDK